MELGLIQTGFLFGLLALAIPIMIHMIFRQQPRQVELGSIRFLKEILEKHRGRRKVMRWLLLALRMLCLALLAFLFARPFVNESRQGRDERFTAVLIDHSASMQLRNGGHSLLEEAIQQTRQLVSGAESKARFEIALFGHRVTPLEGQGGSAAEPSETKQRSAAERLAQLEIPASYGATDYAAGLRWAHDLCVKAPAETKEVHIFTDMQQSGLDWSEVQPMPPDVRVHVHDLGRDLPNNAAITTANPSRLFTRPGEQVTVRVNLLNAGPFTLDELPVVLSLKNGNRSISKRQKVKLEREAILTVEFELPELTRGLWQGTVTIETIDDLPFDNQRYVAIMAAPQYDVLLVDGDPHPSGYLSETYFLESALRLAPHGQTYKDSPYLPTVLDRPDVLPDLTQWDLVVLANVGDLRSDEIHRLGRFVRGGGGLIVFTGPKVTGENTQALADAGLTPGKVVGRRESIDLPWRLVEWDTMHSIMKPFNDPQHGDLRKLAFRGYTAVEPDTETTTLAEFNSGIPLLTQQQVEEGDVLWFLSGCDQQWGNWSRSRLFLPLVHQMLGYLTGMNEGGPVREVVIDSTSADLTDQKPGVYQRQDRFWQVVNTSPRESEMNRCSIDDFVKRFALTVDESAAAAASAAMAPTSLEIRKNEIWHWILFALVALLCLEFLIANRATA